MLTLRKCSNGDAAIITLLKALQISITPEVVTAEMEKHPDNPSILAISDVLNWFKIDNGAYKVNSDK